MEFAYFAILAVEPTWMYRNKVLRGHTVPNMHRLSRNLNRLAHQYMIAGDSKLQGYPNSQQTPKWNAPTLGLMKLNFDTTFVEDSTVTVVLVRNLSGDILAAKTTFKYVSNPLKLRHMLLSLHLNW